ncbi:MAG: hypothetical protein ABSA23_02180 [Anaerolineales bacterium]|jgi:hypothetical protein
MNSLVSQYRMSASPSPNQVTPKLSSLSHSTDRFGSRPRTTGAISGSYLRYSLWLGAITGFVLSTALWAYETFLLVQSHVAYPWIPYLVGTILFMGVCASAALLTCLLNRALLGIVFWVLAGRLMAVLLITIPLKIAPGVMFILEPGLQSRLPAYVINSTFRSWEGFGTIVLAIFLGILGLLQLTIVDQSVPAVSPAGRLTAYFVFVPIVLLASVMVSDMINQQLRAPMLATNQLIQFAIDHQNTKVDPTIARQMQLSTIDPIASLIDRPRRLFLGKYDETFLQVDVLVDFGGKWVDCTTVSLQPVYCQIK